MGANRFTGEVEFEAEGKKYTFRLGTNDLIRLQGDMGLQDDDAKFLERLNRITGLRIVRQIMAAGLKRHHPSIEDDEVGNIIDALGGPAAGDVIRRAMRWMLPEPKQEKAGGSAGKGDGSVGETSSPTPPEQVSDPPSAMS